MSDPIGSAAGDGGFSPHIEFSRDEWARLRGATPLTLDQADLDALRSADEHVSMDEVMEVYLPLSRLLNLYVAATQQLFRVTDNFLGSPAARVPYVIAVAGSVAGGKSTTSRILQALLARWPDHPKVDLVTTDGFLFPNAVLEERGIMHRKGFPESYDVRRLVRFLAELKSGAAEVRAPVYSHLIYDIVAGRELVVRRPDILILEGLNVLQTGGPADRPSRVFVSDFFDFSIYIDAREEDLETWYLQRFQRLRETAFRDPTSFFHQYATGMSEQEAMEFGHQVWATINAVNLRENIEPTRERARLILEKGKDHRIERVWLRKL
ncbi:MAG TPA: type I pantothenate kinase [Longimicrobium sp.]